MGSFQESTAPHSCSDPFGGRCKVKGWTLRCTPLVSRAGPFLARCCCDLYLGQRGGGGIHDTRGAQRQLLKLERLKTGVGARGWGGAGTEPGPIWEELAGESGGRQMLVLRKPSGRLFNYLITH